MIQHIFKIIWKKRGQNGFLFFELILSFLVLFAVFSLIIKHMNLYQTPLGFDTENVGVAFIDFEGVKKDFMTDSKVQLSNDKIQSFMSKNSSKSLDTLAYLEKLERVKQAVNEISGIEKTAYSINVVPFNNSNWISGNEQNDPEIISYTRTNMLFCDEDYADALNFSFNAGKWFTKEDAQGLYTPVVVNQKFVDKFVKEKKEIIGAKLVVWGNTCTITGVVKHFKYQGEFKEEKPMILPHISVSMSHNAILMKFDSKVNPNWEYDLQQTLEQELKGASFFQYQLDHTRKATSKSTWTLIYGLLMLCIFLIINVAMGIFGVLQYNIKRRKGEIGLRKALGAKAFGISLQFVQEMLIIASIALAFGVLLAIQVPLLNIFDLDNSIFYKSILYALIFIYVLVILCSLIPSFQASKLEPAVALRENG